MELELEYMVFYEYLCDEMKCQKNIKKENFDRKVGDVGYIYSEIEIEFMT